MKNKEIVGIDVSKNVLDVYILSVKYHFSLFRIHLRVLPDSLRLLPVNCKRVFLLYSFALKISVDIAGSSVFSCRIAGLVLVSLMLWILNVPWVLPEASRIKKMLVRLLFMPGADVKNLLLLN